MECFTDPASLLISAYKERNILPDLDQIYSAFPEDNDDRGDNRNASWVSNHLKYDTLLSREELTLFSKLESSGDLRNISRNTDADATGPLLDDQDIRSTIKSMNASTATVEEQAQALATQFENCSRYTHGEDDRWTTDISDPESPRWKHTIGWQNINAAAGNLTHELEESLKCETDNATVESKRILSWLMCQLTESDKSLANLDRLVSEIRSTGDKLSIMEKVSRLSEVLSEYAAEEVYCRLDRLYLDFIRTRNPDPDDSINKGEIVTTLEEDLESLYLEIGILARMSISQQFNEPILRELQDQHGRECTSSQEILKYVSK
ncbi:hypothetical protein PHISCL_06522 [Aspergillus sclerotialis]|uniref:Uncharacterized protein n=1 Tax=Aspergillus sclerotialis TaxID=2070753 RepID=A0A3A2ZIC1_9EURO|nr:hypothetical protein PHISCL_06522 [Aspergillus sclerotialis]